MDVAVGEKLCPRFRDGFGGVYPFLSNALKTIGLIAYRPLKCIL